MISVVIPAYNEEKNIARCLDSLCEQKTSQKFEVIVVDNNSTDNTVQIADRYKNKLNLKIIRQKKKGRGAARMAGFKEARGEMILSTDADTTHPINWIEMLVNSFVDNTIAVTGPWQINDCGYFSNTTFNLVQLLLMRISRLIFGHYCLSGSNFAIKKDAYNQVQGFDESLSVMEDVDLFFQVSKIGKIRFVKKSAVISSGRRFKGGLIKGSLEYVPLWVRYHLKKTKDVDLSDPR
jgi:glycosyltransferase involved in cell wall biosynthesis